MKKYFFLTLLLSFSLNIFSQDNSAKFYQAKAKKQNTVAWVLLGTGVAASIVGGGISSDNVLEEIFVDSQDKGYETGSTIAVIGLGTAVLCIPFFIAAAKNRKKGMASVAMKMETTPAFQKRQLVQTGFPAVSLSIRL